MKFNVTVSCITDSPYVNSKIEVIEASSLEEAKNYAEYKFGKARIIEIKETQMTHQQAINLAHDLERPFCLVSYRDDGSILSVVPNHIHTLPEWVGFTRDQALREFCEILPCEEK